MIKETIYLLTDLFMPTPKLFGIYDDFVFRYNTFISRKVTIINLQSRKRWMELSIFWKRNIRICSDTFIVLLKANFLSFRRDSNIKDTKLYAIVFNQLKIRRKGNKFYFQNNMLARPPSPFRTKWLSS